VFPDKRTAGQVWVFDDADSPARALTTTGFNNACNWGIRGILPVGDEHLFFGTNQGWQYPTEPRDNPPRRAGWQLLKLTPTDEPGGLLSRLDPLRIVPRLLAVKDAMAGIR
jgi:hypothetical protein